MSSRVSFCSRLNDLPTHKARGHSAPDNVGFGFIHNESVTQPHIPDVDGLVWADVARVHNVLDYRRKRNLLAFDVVGQSLRKHALNVSQPTSGDVRHGLHSDFAEN